MRDIVLVTVECLRADYGSVLETVDALDQHATGIAPGPWTRPSLAGLLSSQYAAAAETPGRRPTLASVLREKGYTSIAISDSPQTQDAFGFSRGFGVFSLPTPGEETLSRGSKWRERLANISLIRRVHRMVNPKRATLNSVRPDSGTVASATSVYDAHEPPRFLWVHLMDSHRPYGRGEKALEQSASRAAANASPEGLLSGPSDAQHEQVVEHYERSLERAAGHVSDICASVSDDAIVIVCGDHGEELGEDGYYFHAGHRQRVVDELVRVPVATRNLDVPDLFGLVDVPALVCDAVGVDAPPQWDGSTEHQEWLTVAPWADSVTVRHTTPERKMVFEDASSPATAHRDEQPEAKIREQLQSLGYADVG